MKATRVAVAISRVAVAISRVAVAISAITVDVTAFWRPTLRNCPNKHYHPAANRALPAVIFGVIGEVGHIGDQRLACPLAFERVPPKDPCESRLWQELLRWATFVPERGRHLAPDDVAVMDAGVKLVNVHAAGLEGYLLRLATNFTESYSSRPSPQPALVLWRQRPQTRLWRGDPPAGTQLQGPSEYTHTPLPPAPRIG